MTKGKVRKILYSFIAIAGVAIATFLLIEKPVNIALYNSRTMEETEENKFIPNYSTWYEGNEQTLYINGYTKFSDLFVDGELDYNLFSESFTYMDDGTHHPSSPQMYQNWFKIMGGAGNGFIHGGEQLDANFSLELSDPPKVNEAGVQYYIEEVRIDNLEMFWAYGGLHQISIKSDAVMDKISEFLHIPELIEKIKEVMGLFEDGVINIPFPPKPPKWWPDRFNSSWPEEEPEWWDQLPILIIKKSIEVLESILNGQLDELLDSLGKALVTEVLWQGLIIGTEFIPVVGPFVSIGLRFIHKFFKFGVVWKEKNHYETLVDDTIGSIVKGETILIEGDDVILKPTTDGTSESKWTPIFEFNNNFFHEDEGIKNDENIILEYKWIENDKTINFKLENLNDFSTTIALGGSWTFLNAIDIDYSEKVVKKQSDYSFENDIFGDYNNQNNFYHQTQDKFFSANATNVEDYYLPKDIYGNEKPYFSKENTYYDLEEYILQNNLLSSRDKVEDISDEDIILTFYDEDDMEIEKSSNIDKSVITFTLETSNNNSKIHGKSRKLTYEIPYINFDNIYSNKNIMDYSPISDVIFDNSSSFIWKYNELEEIWVLETNEQFDLKLDYYDGVSEYYIDYDEGTDIFGELDKENPIANISVPHDQSSKNELLNNQNIGVHLVDESSKTLNEYRGFDFKVNYNSENDNKFIIKDSIGTELITETNIVDLHKESKYVLPDEIYESATTLNGFNISSDEEFIQYQYIDSNWMEINKSTYFETSDNGLYGFSQIDEWGNNKFIVVEKISEVEDSLTSTWKDSIEYERDLNFFLEQSDSSEEIFENYSSQEYRHINLMVNSGAIPNISRVLIKNPLQTSKLSKITNGFENNTTEFSENQNSNGESISLKKSLEREIENEMNIRGFSEEMYQVKWDINDTELINNELVDIKFTIIPKGYWNSIGEISYSFKLYEYTSLKRFNSEVESQNNSTNELEYTTNLYSDSIPFGKKANNLSNEYKSLRDDLNAKILNQLNLFGISSEYNDDIQIQWNISDEECVSTGDILEYKISSNSYMIHDEYTGFLTSKTRKDLSELHIDSAALTEVTSNYFNNISFGLQYGDENSNSLRKSLEIEITNQLSEQNIYDEEVQIQFIHEDGHYLNDYEKVESGMILKYEIKSNSSKYFGELTGDFEVNTFESLAKLNSPLIALIKITNQYESGSRFINMKKELENCLDSFYSEKGIDVEKIDYVWSVYDEQNIECIDSLTFDIESNDFDYIKGDFNEEKNGTFTALPFYELDAFILDDSNIIENLEANIGNPFSTIYDDTQNEIEKQLSEQGYNVELLNIDWSIGNGEIINSSKEINLTIYGKDSYNGVTFDGLGDLIIHGEKNYEFKMPNTSENSKKFSYLFYSLIVVITLFIIITIISGLIIWRKMKLKKNV